MRGNVTRKGLAKQDCVPCGYNYANYSNAPLLRQEGRPDPCVPVGRQIARLSRSLEAGNAPSPSERASTAALATVAPAGGRGCARNRRTAAVFLSRTRFDKPGWLLLSGRLRPPSCAGGMERAP